MPLKLLLNRGGYYQIYLCKNTTDDFILLKGEEEPLIKFAGKTT
jgi:hypothetical protein